MSIQNKEFPQTSKKKQMTLKKNLILSALFGAFILLSAAALDRPESALSTHDSMLSMRDGQEIYLTRCMSCHQTNGEGVQGVFPPLAGSEYVTGDKGVLIRMVLGGLSGEIEVNGTTYSGMMPPWGGFLTDEQVAQVLTYVRVSFGNEAEAVTTEEVAKVRAATASRTQTWTIEDLKQEANQGIPGGE